MHRHSQSTFRLLIVTQVWAIICLSLFQSCYAEQEGAPLKKSEFLPLYEQYLTQKMISLIPNNGQQIADDAVIKLTVAALKSIIAASYLENFSKELATRICEDSIPFAERYRIIGERDLEKARIAIVNMKTAVISLVKNPIDKEKFLRAEAVAKRTNEITGKVLREWVSNSAITMEKEDIPSHVIDKAGDLAPNQFVRLIDVKEGDIPGFVTEKSKDLAPLVGEPDLNKYLRQYVMDCIDWAQIENSKSDHLFMNNFFMQFIAQKKVPDVIKDLSDEEIIAYLKRITFVADESRKTQRMRFTSIKVEVLQKFVDATNFAKYGGSREKP